MVHIPKYNIIGAHLYVLREAWMYNTISPSSLRSFRLLYGVRIPESLVLSITLYAHNEYGVGVLLWRVHLISANRSSIGGALTYGS